MLLCCAPYHTIAALKPETKIIGQPKITALFANISAICALNNKLLTELEDRIGAWKHSDEVCFRCLLVVGLFLVSVWVACVSVFVLFIVLCCAAEHAASRRGVRAVRTVPQDLRAGLRVACVYILTVSFALVCAQPRERGACAEEDEQQNQVDQV